LALTGDDITVKANDNISLAAKNVAIDAVFNATSAATFNRSVTFNGQGIFKAGLSVQGADVAFGSGVDLKMGTNSIKCGNIEVNSGYTIKIGVDEVALKKDMPTDYVKTSNFNKKTIEALLSGDSSMASYLRNAIIADKSYGSFNSYIESIIDAKYILKQIGGDNIRDKLKGNYSSFSDYMLKVIGSTKSGNVESLNDHIKRISAGHKHDVSVSCTGKLDTGSGAHTHKISSDGKTAQSANALTIHKFNLTTSGTATTGTGSF